jgi:hypothetical protein
MPLLSPPPPPLPIPPSRIRTQPPLKKSGTEALSGGQDRAYLYIFFGILTATALLLIAGGFGVVTTDINQRIEIGFVLPASWGTWGVISCRGKERTQRFEVRLLIKYS